MNTLIRHATRDAVSVNGLRKAYGEKVVLEGVDFSIGEGEVFGLLGPNGAGKTTMVRILMHSVAPKEAAIWIADKRDALSDPEFRAIYLEYDAAYDWSPNDPRLYALTDRSERWLANRSRRLKGGPRSVQDPTIAQLVATAVGASSPAWDRLTKIAKERKAGG